MPYTVKITTTKPADTAFYGVDGRQAMLDYMASRVGYISYDDLTYSTEDTVVIITTFDTEENYNNYVIGARMLPEVIVRSAYNNAHAIKPVPGVLYNFPEDSSGFSADFLPDLSII